MNDGNTLFTYMTYDGFFNRLDEIPCFEAKLALHEMVNVLRSLRECADDEKTHGSKEMAKGISFCADELSEKLEDYVNLCRRHRDAVEFEHANPERN